MLKSRLEYIEAEYNFVFRVYVEQARHLSPPPSSSGSLLQVINVKLCPGTAKFRAQSAGNEPTDPIFDKGFSFLVSELFNPWRVR